MRILASSATRWPPSTTTPNGREIIGLELSPFDVETCAEILATVGVRDGAAAPLVFEMTQGLPMQVAFAIDVLRVVRAHHGAGRGDLSDVEALRHLAAPASSSGHQLPERLLARLTADERDALLALALRRWINRRLTERLMQPRGAAAGSSSGSSAVD